MTARNRPGGSISSGHGAERLAARSPPAERVRARRSHDRVLGRDRRHPAYRSSRAGRRGRPPASRSPTVAVTVGSLGTIIFGIWLAISLDGVAVWSGWVIAAIILWAIGTETGRRGGTYFADVHRPRDGARCFREDGPRREARRARAHAARAAAPLDLVARDPADPHRHDLEAGRLMLASMLRPDRPEPAALRPRPRRDDPRRRPARDLDERDRRARRCPDAADRRDDASLRLPAGLHRDARRRAVDLLARAPRRAGRTIRPGSGSATSPPTPVRCS